MLLISPILSIIFLVPLAVMLVLFVVTSGDNMPQDELRLFEFAPVEMVHSLSRIVIALIVLAGKDTAAPLGGFWFTFSTRRWRWS
jgi:hypothetical protein